MALRDLCNLKLEAMRNEKVIGRSMEAQVELIHPNPETRSYLKQNQELIRQVLIVGKMQVTENISSDEQLNVVVSKAEGDKCSRCWNTDEAVGKSQAHPELCSRCEEIVVSIRQNQ